MSSVEEIRAKWNRDFNDLPVEEIHEIYGQVAGDILTLLGEIDRLTALTEHEVVGVLSNFDQNYCAICRQPVEVATFKHIDPLGRLERFPR